MSERKGFLHRIHLWSIVNRNDRKFFLFCSLVVGLIAGFLALGLKSAVFYLRDIVISDSSSHIRALLFGNFYNICNEEVGDS